MVLVDTNILVYLLIEGDRTSSAHELYARDSDWRSEAFILVELSNVLATYVRNRGLSLSKGKDLLADAETRLPALRNVSHAEALETAAEFEISAYDARFIALAKELRVRLVTEDAKLLAAAPSLTRSLADAIGWAPGDIYAWWPSVARHRLRVEGWFIYGFAKNERANVSDRELKALKLLAKELLNYPAVTLTKAIDAGELIEIEVNDDG